VLVAAAVAAAHPARPAAAEARRAKPDWGTEMIGRHIFGVKIVPYAVVVVAAATGTWVAAQGTAPPPQSGSYTDDIPRPPFKRLVGPQTLNPGEGPYHFPYPDEYDSAVAASSVHHIRYADAHVRFVEVAYFPGVHGKMHGHPYPSVFAIDAPAPRSYNVNLVPDSGMIFSRSQAPAGAPAWPICVAAGPQAPHAETNQDSWPHHFYRLEFLRIDGHDFAARWKEWYPRMADPLPLVKDVKPPANAPRLSAAWPYPLAYDSVVAAPNNHRLLYENDHVRLVEVTIRPGELENMHGHPYPSVFAYDAVGSGPIGARGNQAATIQDHYLDPASRQNGQDRVVAGLPQGMDAPGCATMGPQAPHKARNTSSVPLHFYRIEFKRIDGEELRTRWREWYPWMGRLADAYAQTPYPLNY